MRAPIAMLVASTCFALCVGGGGGGCVTEIIPVKSASPTGRSGMGSPLSSNGPITTATPGGATSMSRVAAAILPLGTVPYDGVTLPLVTPDGRWLVTQTGPLPSWESVLAEPGALPVPASAVKVFEIADGKLRPIDWSPNQGAVTFDTPPSSTNGLLLGRCAGVSGQDGWALVERPNPNGSRWIGKLTVATGVVEWLVQGTAVNAQAILLRDDTLVYTRRLPDQSTSELVILPASGAQPVLTPSPQESSDSTKAARPVLPPPGGGERVARRDGWKYCQPLTTPDQTMVAVLAIGPQDALLLAYSTTQVDSTGAPLLIAKEAMGALGAAEAFQAVTSVEACPPEIDSGLRSSFLLVNADRQRLAVWDPIKGSMSLLPASVAAGARVHSPVASGLVMASPRGMDFWTGSGVPARLVAGSYIPRSSSGPDGTRLICLSPQTGTSAPTLNVISVQLVAPKP